MHNAVFREVIWKHYTHNVGRNCLVDVSVVSQVHEKPDLLSPDSRLIFFCISKVFTIV